MKKGRNKALKTMRLLIVAVAATLFAACASIGRPDGGPRDMDPPVFVRSVPAPSALNVNRNKIEIYFNENVQLDDVTNKVVVSPAQQVQPIITANGRKVTVELRDTLLPNTTYTIDFADAIADLNEKNILDGFAIDFATGDSIDSLRISGMVLAASNLEPAIGMLVGAYSNPADSAIETLKMERITKTNQYGQFTLRNLKPGAYRVFAVNDLNRDFHWDRSEDIAFLDSLVVPYSDIVVEVDTLKTADGRDSLATIQAVRYMPNNILLTWFNEEYKPQYLADNNRPERNRIYFRLGAPTDTLPTFRVANGPQAGRDLRELARLEASPTLDTLNFWLTDSLLVHQDSLLIQANYQKLDSLENLVWTTDTLRMFMRPAKPKKQEKVDAEPDSVPKPIEFYKLTLPSSPSQDLHKPIVIKSDVPVASIDTAAIKMQMLVDTIWTDVAPPKLRPNPPYSSKSIVMDYDWPEGEKYRLTVDSAAIYSIYGLYNKPIKMEFTTKKSTDYGTIIFNITGLDSIPAVAQLLGSNDEPIAAVPVVDSRATFNYLPAGTYYARLFLDANGNGKYDTGNLHAGLQPEEVYYYPKKVALKQAFTVRQSWDIYETALDLQKPYEIKKNKPKLRPDTFGQDDEEELEEEDPYSDPFLSGRDPNPFRSNH
ncbi:MAG: Ig-like domain-containing protein [Muribaculaceae bacterium]|nr:Ig-like domain-containing protein [Muribaculaceae bacterium]